MSHVVSFRFWRINIISNIFRTFYIVLEENYIAIIIVIELSPSPSIFNDSLYVIFIPKSQAAPADFTLSDVQPKNTL